MQVTRQITPKSDHFSLEELADGVYAAIASSTGAATGNAGIIDLGDRTLVFDTFLTPKAGVDLRDAAEALTGRPVDFVFNSHFHNDHIRGNQVFEEQTLVVATSGTRELMITGGAAELQDDQESSRPMLEVIRERIEAEKDPEELREARFFEGYLESIIESLPSIRIRLPDLTFDGRLEFHGAGRTVEALTFGGGHTRSDGFLYLPGERIVFAGDLLFVGAHPWILDGDPDALVSILARIEGLDVEIAVPGHGPVGDRSHLAANRQYIGDLVESVKQVVARGGTADEAAALDIPGPYGDWTFHNFYPQNMRFLWKRLSAQAAS